MKAANQQRVHKAITAFSLIAAVLSLEHITVLVYCLLLGIDLDRSDPFYGDRHLNFYLNLPFAIALGVVVAKQVLSCLTIFIGHTKSQMTKGIYMCSIFGMLGAFSLGVYLTVQAEEYNVITRSWQKETDDLPQLMPFYWNLQIDATISLLFVLPMMIFIFLNYLPKYLALKREESNSAVKPMGKRGEMVCLCIFIVHILAQIAYIVNLYQFSSHQNTVNYTADNKVDVFAFYLAVAVVIETITVSLLLKNAMKSFLDKKKVICLGIITTLLQMGSFVINHIQVAKLHVEIIVVGDDLCKIYDCHKLHFFTGELMAWGAINLIALITQIFYLKRVARKVEWGEERDTLLTAEEVVKE